jgi:hypothetical protein
MTLNLKNLQLPKLKLNELLINEVESEKSKELFIYYCINDASEHKKAVEAMSNAPLMRSVHLCAFFTAFS